MAVQLYETGSDPEERERVAAALAAQPEMKEEWLRRLVQELRRTGGGRRQR